MVSPRIIKLGTNIGKDFMIGKFANYQLLVIEMILCNQAHRNSENTRKIV